MSTILERVDAQLDELFQGWNYLTFIILTVLFVVLIYPIVTAKDPDTHPLLLARQANVSPVRQPRESAVYRALDVPHGYPLKSGLNVRDPDTPKYAGGKDGDLRSIWRRAVEGDVDSNGVPTGKKGKIVTVRGTEKAIEHDFAKVSKEINAIGSYVKQKDAKYVAVYLPNSIELLTVVFAAAYYGFSPVLIPYGKPKEAVLKLLNLTEADFLIAAAGSIPSKDVHEQCTGIKEVMWVVEETSREVDWTDASEGTSSWHEIVDEQGAQASTDLPTTSSNDTPPNVVTLWFDDTSPSSGELVAFTQGNIVAAVSAQTTALPRTHRINNADVFLPADALTTPSILILTLAALFSNATLALSSVSGPDIPLTSIAPRINPTIIAGTSAQAFQLHESTTASIETTPQRLALYNQRQTLASGLMPSPSRVLTPVRANLATSLRLLYILNRTHSDTPPTSSARLRDLRAFTGARVIHGLTTAKVAGPIAQTTLFDYRVDDAEDGNAEGHFGTPLGCLELLVRDQGEFVTDDGVARGKIIARGPAVLGGEAELGVVGEFMDDGCLKYLFEHPEGSTRPEKM